MRKYFYFGEQINGYDIPVLNEREARAAAGILFLFGMVSFFNSYLLHDFRFTKIFVTVFMIDFFIRVVINPKYAPSIILARFFVQYQAPEYVGAPQKRWSWSIGLALAVIMFFIIVVFELMTPIKIAVCLICLGLLFSEAAFGICIGCKLYHFVKKETLYCPGGNCEVQRRDNIQKISALQAVILSFSLLLFTSITYISLSDKSQERIPGKFSAGKYATGKCSSGRCGGGK